MTFSALDAIAKKAVIFSAFSPLLAGCAGESVTDDHTQTVRSAITLGGHVGGISDGAFAEARDNFNLQEEVTDGIGPVFNERACGNCHTLGAQGGAGVQIERRYGRFVNGVFDSMDSSGGSLRQLFSVGTFTTSTGRTCTVPVEREPAGATVHNVGRLTTPLFGLGLVDAMPDAFFRSRPPVSKHTPLPTRVTFGCVSLPQMKSSSRGARTLARPTAWIIG